MRFGIIFNNMWKLWILTILTAGLWSIGAVDKICGRVQHTYHKPYRGTWV